MAKKGSKKGGAKAAHASSSPSVPDVSREDQALTGEEPTVLLSTPLPNASTVTGPSSTSVTTMSTLPLSNKSDTHVTYAPIRPSNLTFNEQGFTTAPPSPVRSDSTSSMVFINAHGSSDVEEREDSEKDETLSISPLDSALADSLTIGLPSSFGNPVHGPGQNTHGHSIIPGPVGHSGPNPYQPGDLTRLRPSIATSEVLNPRNSGAYANLEDDATVRTDDMLRSQARTVDRRGSCSDEADVPLPGPEDDEEEEEGEVHTPRGSRLVIVPDGIPFIPQGFEIIPYMGPGDPREDRESYDARTNPQKEKGRIIPWSNIRVYQEADLDDYMMAKLYPRDQSEFLPLPVVRHEKQKQHFSLVPACCVCIHPPAAPNIEPLAAKCQIRQPRKSRY